MFSDKRLIIGCPVKGREWMIEPWIDAVRTAVSIAEIPYTFFFLIDDGDPVIEEIDRVCKSRDVQAFYRTHRSYTDPFKEHNWSEARIEYMVELRNSLLETVREYGPDYFLSLDSDILLHPEAISGMLSMTNKHAAVGGKTYLTRNSKLPSYAMINKFSKNMIRTDIDHTVTVDVIMAIKLMTSEAYNINYSYDRRGEDIGWSLNCKAAGLKLGYDGRYASKHIMERTMLDTIDKRVGY